MTAVAILLSALAGITLPVLYLVWRRRLRPRPAAATERPRLAALPAPGTAPPSASRALAAVGRPQVRAPVWRPPPRDLLLRRQEARRQALAGSLVDAEPETRLKPAPGRARARLIPEEPPRRAPLPDPVAALPAGIPRPSRIGRKRQGLESLITELPQSPTGGASHDTHDH